MCRGFGRSCPCRSPGGFFASALTALTLVAAHLSAGRGAAEEIAVASPNGAARFQLLRGEGSRLAYRVTFRKQPVIETSPLAVTVDGVELTKGAGLGEVRRYQIDEQYPWR